MEFSMKKMKTLKSAFAIFAPAAALCYLFSLNVIHTQPKAVQKIALIKSERSIQNLNQRAWYQQLLPKQPIRAIAMKK